MADVMEFTRQDFIDYVFQPYNSAVKRGAYHKINYDAWKEIRSWAYDDKYNDGWTIRIFEEKNYCDIYPYHKAAIVTTSGFTIMEDDVSFAAWIKDNRKNILLYDKTIQEALGNTKISFACSSNGVAYGKMKEKEKENKEMLKFDFGPVNSCVHMSMYGMAIKNAAGTYVAYDAESGQVMDVDVLNFDGADKFMYKMPVALGSVRSGDVVVHNGKPCFVQAVLSNGRLRVLDIYDSEEKHIVPLKSPFGFDFITKIVSLFDFSKNNADTTNPFGNMLPFLLMSDSKSKDDILPFMLMMNDGKMDMSNPMMMYVLLSKDGKMNDMLPFMLMGGFAANPNGCCGNCSCDKDK